MAFRCRECESELDHVYVNWSGWATYSTTSYSKETLIEMGGDVDIDLNGDTEDEETGEWIDGDAKENLVSYECPECGVWRPLLYDLVELFDEDGEPDEVEEDEVGVAEDGHFHAFLIVSAATGKMQGIGWFETLAEAKQRCDELTSSGGLCVQDAPFTSRRSASTALAKGGEVWGGPVVYVPAKTATRSRSNDWLEKNLAEYGKTLADVSGSGKGAAPEGRDELAKIVASLE